MVQVRVGVRVRVRRSRVEGAARSPLHVLDRIASEHRVDFGPHCAAGLEALHGLAGRGALSLEGGGQPPRPLRGDRPVRDEQAATLLLLLRRLVFLRPDTHTSIQAHKHKQEG